MSNYIFKFNPNEEHFEIVRTALGYKLTLFLQLQTYLRFHSSHSLTEVLVDVLVLGTRKLEEEIQEC